MNPYSVWFDRVPGRDQYALYVAKRSLGGTVYLQADGDWFEYGEDEVPPPTLMIHGVDWNRNSPLKSELTKALGGVPEGAPDTEVRVLREWLAVERARVERAFDR